MSTTKHTPGPWFVERAGRNPRVLAKPKGFRSTPENPVFVVTNNVYISADKDEATANAHLIAASPDLYRTLSELFAAVELLKADLIGNLITSTNYEALMKPAWAALKAARGER